ncbi:MULTISPECIES: alpha-galactosidase [Glycomyces]|uniref:alpha-galactosidase n=2 Tax=Glycomyces TaxID=58113 RepID=A0A9X3PN37_9ACTN|nr:alpha-galactosidase [Glycomyces lechevalierae]MDA1385972.1 alpha-galactosidase [Glycomyces lechevalierae]MDR7340871.1 alpha-galactosidase [Glycomyces lechevalierae]
MTLADGAFTWRLPDLHLSFAHGDRPVRLTGLSTGPDAPSALAPQEIVDLFTAAEMRARSSQAYVWSHVGARLRYVDHTAGDTELVVRQRDARTGLEVASRFRSAGPGLQISHTVRNTSDADVVLTAVTSAQFAVPLGDLDLLWGEGEWLGEGRWHQRPLTEYLPDLNLEFHGQSARGHFALTSVGAWSSGTVLPTGVLANPEGPSAAWQIETSAGWHWEVSQRRDAVIVSVLGPTDLEHQFAERLAPGAEFTSVPAGLVVADGGRDAAIGALTGYRRAIRRLRPADAALPVVYNDFMNTLMGDPTTEKLLPIIEAAADAGAEYFCIDAGWFAGKDDGWWSGTGEWREGEGRFTGGLISVIDAIHGTGMRAGLWLEPEVLRASAPLAQTLPDEAFFCRFGERVIESGAHQLDFRHPAARAHLDATVDRLIADYGVSFFKLDYNINPGAGTDVDAAAPGGGLLAHTRAYRDWLLAVQARHPEVLFESCSSGAMRMDYGLLSAAHLQSTSDQQDFRLYPPIAAAAPLSVVPEQAGNWAYPAEGMSPEETAFAMVAGIMGRLYLSGFLHRLDEQQTGLVHEAVALHQDWRQRIAASRPSWPLGLPGWNDDVIALVLDAGDRSLLAVWSRGEAAEVALPQLRGSALDQVYPARLAAWKVRTDDGVPVIEAPAGPAARVFEVTPA